MNIEEIVAEFNKERHIHTEKSGKEYNTTELFACKRKLELRREGKKAVKPDRIKDMPNFMRQGVLSNFVHDSVERTLEKKGWLIPDHANIDFHKKFGEYTIYCKPDAIWYDVPDKVIYPKEILPEVGELTELIELKCPMYYNGKPPDSHVFQVGIYMNITGAEKGTLIYMNHNGFEDVPCERMDDDDIVWLIENWGSPNFAKECDSCWYKDYCDVK